MNYLWMLFPLWLYSGTFVIVLFHFVTINVLLIFYVEGCYSNAMAYIYIYKHKYKV